MIQKTIRFYTKLPADQQAVERLAEHERWGYSSEREMVVAAINNLIKKGDEQSTVITAGGVDAIAERVVELLGEQLQFVQINNHVEEKENEDVFQTAMQFINSL